MITGVTLLPVGLSDDNGGVAAAGAITLGSGVALLTLGILGIFFDSPTYQPGSSVHFALDENG